MAIGDNASRCVPLRAALQGRTAAQTALHQGQEVGHFCPEMRLSRRTTFWLDGVDSPHLCRNQSAERKHLLR